MKVLRYIVTRQVQRITDCRPLLYDFSSDFNATKYVLAASFAAGTMITRAFPKAPVQVASDLALPEANRDVGFASGRAYDRRRVNWIVGRSRHIIDINSWQYTLGIQCLLKCLPNAAFGMPNRIYKEEPNGDEALGRFLELTSSCVRSFFLENFPSKRKRRQNVMISF